MASSPTDTNRCSPSADVSSQVSADGSKSTASASPNRTPCFATLAAALRGSHVTRIYVSYTYHAQSARFFTSVERSRLPDGAHDTTRAGRAERLFGVVFRNRPARAALPPRRPYSSPRRRPGQHRRTRFPIPGFVLRDPGARCKAKQRASEFATARSISRASSPTPHRLVFRDLRISESSIPPNVV